MRRLITGLAAALLVVLLALAALLFIAIDRQPLVERSTVISPIAVAQARLSAMLETREAMPFVAAA